MNTPQEDRPLKQLFSATKRADAAEAPPFHQLGHSARFERRVRRERRITRLAVLVSAASLAVAAVALWFAFRKPTQEPVVIAAAPPPVEETRPDLPVQTVPPVKAPEPVDEAREAQGNTVDASEEPAPNPGRIGSPDPRVIVPDDARSLVATDPEPVQGEQPQIWVGNFVAEEGEGVGERLASGNAEEPQRKTPTKTGGTTVASTAGTAVAEKPEPSDIGDPTTRSVLEGYVGMLSSSNLAGSMGPDGHHVTMTQASNHPDQLQREFAREIFNVHGNETYVRFGDHRMVPTTRSSLSQFAGDADTASYTNIRRFLSGGELPPRNAVRVEEMLNYFTFDYPEPENGETLSVDVEIAGCPWKPEHRLARIGVRAVDSRIDHYPGSHLVWVIDASRSMEQDNRLAGVKEMMRQATYQLQSSDKISIVAFADETRVLATAVPATERSRLLEIIEEIEPRGRTDGTTAIEVAYKMAERLRVPGGVNRVILVSDGDFTRDGPPSSGLLGMMRNRGQYGIFLTVLGIGTGNLKDDVLERLADWGNGVYHYLDSPSEAQRFAYDASRLLVTVAQDVKLAVMFDPEQVGAWRLIGYENRALGDGEMDRRSDGAELPAGSTMTALYEIVPRALFEAMTPDNEDRLEISAAGSGGPAFAAVLTYRVPLENQDRILMADATDDGGSFEDASDDFQFAACVAEFGMGLRSGDPMDLDRIRQGCNAGRRSVTRADFMDLLDDYREVVADRSMAPR